MKRFNVALLIIVMAIAFSAGCGGSSSDTPEQTSRYSWSNETNVEPSEGDTPEESPSPSASSNETSQTTFGPTVCGFWGSVTVNGSTAPDGTTVRAHVNNITVSSTKTNGGEYSIKVTSLPGIQYDGKTVTLSVNGSNAEQATWRTGGNFEVDLEIP